jgi:hypothetical protein
VGSIQQTKVNNLLKVLFDSGSDKTIFKKSSLPQGIEPSTGKKRKVSGVTTSSVIDQYVMLKDITLPEFSSSQRIPGPIQALLMPMEAQYDVSTELSGYLMIHYMPKLNKVALQS